MSPELIQAQINVLNAQIALQKLQNDTRLAQLQAQLAAAQKK